MYIMQELIQQCNIYRKVLVSLLHHRSVVQFYGSWEERFPVKQAVGVSGRRLGDIKWNHVTSKEENLFKEDVWKSPHHTLIVHFSKVQLRCKENLYVWTEIVQTLRRRWVTNVWHRWTAWYVPRLKQGEKGDVLIGFNVHYAMWPLYGSE